MGIIIGLLISGSAGFVTFFGGLAYAPLQLAGIALYFAGYYLLGIAVRRRRGTIPGDWPRGVAYGTLLAMPVVVLALWDGIDRFVVDACVGFCTDYGLGHLLLLTPLAIFVLIAAAPIAGVLIQGGVYLSASAGGANGPSVVSPVAIPDPQARGQWQAYEDDLATRRKTH